MSEYRGNQHTAYENFAMGYAIALSPEGALLLDQRMQQHDDVVDYLHALQNKYADTCGRNILYEISGLLGDTTPVSQPLDLASSRPAAGITAGGLVALDLMYHFTGMRTDESFKNAYLHLLSSPLPELGGGTLAESSIASKLAHFMRVADSGLDRAPGLQLHISSLAQARASHTYNWIEFKNGFGFVIGLLGRQADLDKQREIASMSLSDAMLGTGDWDAALEAEGLLPKSD